MKQVRAVNTEEAFYTLDPLSPVLPTDPWYCPLESYFDPRHFALTPRLNRLFRPPASLGRTNDYVHVAVVGNQGTGKTTQVRKTMLELESSGIQPAFVDARSALDESNFTFADIMLTIAQTVVNDLREAKINIPAAQYELVKNWFSETLLIEDHRQQILGSLETEASAKGGIPFLANMVAKVTATLKSDNEYRKEIRRRADSDLEKLIFDLNLLLDAANAAWTKKKKRDCTVAVVFDNLEKIKNQELI